MGFSSLKVVFTVIIFVGFLFVQPENVSGLRSVEHALKVEIIHSNPTLAPSPSMGFDLYQSSKRSVGKGSDPIHNKGSIHNKG